MTNPNHFYVVSQPFPGETRPWECSCLGWTRHMPRRDCKHIIITKTNSIFGNFKTLVQELDPLAYAIEKARRE